MTVASKNKDLNAASQQASKSKFWNRVWQRFKSVKKEGFWIINLSVSFAILFKIYDSLFNWKGIWQILLEIVIVIGTIALIKLLLSLAIEMKGLISRWLSTSFWGACIKELAKTQEILMIPNGKDIVYRIDVMKKAIYRLHDIMTLITGTNCGISVKVPQNPQDDPLKWKMITILRDPDHKERDNDKFKAKVHHVAHNTAFMSVIVELRENNWDYKFINNDRNAFRDYRSTSDNCYPSLPQYISEIVVPILQPGDEDSSTLHGLRGFLCVDCVHKNPFRNDEVTASFVSMVAYLLQPLLSNEDSVTYMVDVTDEDNVNIHNNDVEQS